MYISGKETNSKEVGPMKIREYLINKNFSAALIEIDGRHIKMKCLKEDRIYYVVEGEGEFIVKDEINSVKAEDLMFVPMGTPYSFSGKMKILLICSPEFNPEDDVTLE